MADMRPAVLLTFARRGEEETMLRAIALLQQFGCPEIIALGTPVSAPVLRGLGISEVVILDENVSTRAALAQVRARRPRAAAAVYCGPGFGGHLKLEALALLTGAPRLLRVLPGEQARTMGRLRLALGVAGKALQAAGCLVVGACVCGVAWCWLRRVR